jgi:hypothetical protein
MTDSDQQKTVPIFKNINLVPYTGSLSLGGSRFSKIHGSGPQFEFEIMDPAPDPTPAPIPFFTDLRDGEKKLISCFFLIYQQAPLQCGGSGMFIPDPGS